MPRKIPNGLTLDVAIEHCKQARASPTLIEELTKISKEYHGRDRVFDALKDRQRIADQRAAFGLLLDHPHVEAVKVSMLERAWELLDNGQSEACDAILEFLPTDDADKMLDAFFKEGVE